MGMAEGKVTRANITTGALMGRQSQKERCMAGQTVEFSVSMGDKVRSKEHGVEGIVKAFWVDDHGTKHVSIEYNAQGKITERWFDDDKVESVGN